MDTTDPGWIYPGDQRRAMRVLIAFDKFKGALTAADACRVARDALRKIHPDWTFDLCPLTDGGEGFVEILTRAAWGVVESIEVTGPRGKSVAAAYGKIPWHRISPPAQALLGITPPADPAAPLFVLEMSAASGLALLGAGEKNPWLASTYGTGELLQHACDAGAVGIVLGLGGSATHDLGLGALRALGLEFFDAEGGAIRSPTPSTWATLLSLRGELPAGFPPLRLACDVTNPLLGLNGAAATYGPQKGVAEADIASLDRDTEHVARILCRRFGKDFRVASEAGAGAAGGIACGLRVALGAQLVPGFPLVAAWTKIDERLQQADLVLTGEGRFDATSLQGKAAGAIAQRAIASHKPVHVFAGRVDAAAGDETIFTHEISPRALPLEKSLSLSGEFLARKIEDVFEKP